MSTSSFDDRPPWFAWLVACLIAVSPGACKTSEGQSSSESGSSATRAASGSTSSESGTGSKPSSSASGDRAEELRTRRHADPRLASESHTSNLTVAKTFGEAMPTGVTVTSEGRMFVNLPRWGDEPKATVVEVDGGQKRPYPNADVNELDTSKPKSHFLSVQSVRVGPAGDLWILDTGRPRFGPRIEKGAKLVRVDLASDEIERTIAFPKDVVQKYSYTNDVRFDLSRGDEGMAYITDSSGRGFNGIIVVDLASGESWRRLSQHEATQAEPNFTPIVEGEPLMRRSQNGKSSHMSVGSDGIAVGPEGERLYFRPLSGRHLFSVAVDALSNRTIGQKQVVETLRDHGNLGFASDGLEADARGRIYLTNYEDNAIMRWSPEGGLETIVHHPDALWPDTLALVEGKLYWTANQLHRQPTFQGGQDERQPPYPVFAVDVDAEPVRLGP